MDSGLKGKVVLVTGAAGGIGGELVRAFAAEGARVAGHHFRTPLDGLLSSLCLPVRADLTREDEVAALFAAVEKELGPVEVCVANAGVWPEKEVPIHEMSLAQWEGTIAANLTSVFLCMREFFRGVARHALAEPAGVIIGSTAGLFGEAGHCDYAASKSGATGGFLLTLKNELARLSPRGRVNAVCPGWILTPMVGDFASRPEAVRRVLQTVPLRKVGRVADVASAVLYLASARLSGHVTGHALAVTGGMEGRPLYSPEEIDPAKA